MFAFVYRVELDKRFAFARPNGGGQPDRIFIHPSALTGGLILADLLTESRVEVDLMDTPKGPAARKVRPVSFAGSQRQ